MLSANVISVYHHALAAFSCTAICIRNRRWLDSKKKDVQHWDAEVGKMGPRFIDITFQVKHSTTVLTFTVSKTWNTESVQARVFLGLQKTKGAFYNKNVYWSCCARFWLNTDTCILLKVEDFSSNWVDWMSSSWPTEQVFLVFLLSKRTALISVCTHLTFPLFPNFCSFHETPVPFGSSWWKEQFFPQHGHGT